MTNYPEMFRNLNEPYAAGFFEAPDRGLFYRFSLALRRYYEERPVNPWRGGRLYPSGIDIRGDYAVQPDSAKTFNPARGGKGLLKGFLEPLQAKSMEAAEIMLKSREYSNFTIEPGDESITISGYTHSIPYYERILKEGFDGYAVRIANIADPDMREGLQEVLLGLRAYHRRCLDQLRRDEAGDALISALEQVPFKPARNLYEAIVGWNYVAYLDGLDNLGWIDEGLMPYYRGEDCVELLHEMFQNVTVNDGWSCSIGPNWNPITRQCLKAVQGLCRPMMELRVTKDMPEDIWQLALETALTGGGQPAFYNEPMVQEMLADAYPEICKADRMRFSGAGCTETNLAGISNVGGIDANINLALILERYMHQMLPCCESFDAFYRGFCGEVQRCVNIMLDDVSRNHRNRAERLPNPLRSLLIDDCIDRGIDYNAGGARFNGALTAESGMINVIDSLLAIRKLVYEDHVVAPEVLLERLQEEDEVFRRMLKNCPHYGTDEPQVNALTRRFTTFFYGCFDGSRPYRGGRWLPSSHQFNRYTKEGKRVGSTPDGRKAGDALCDSIAPLSEKTGNGPTAALMSAAQICQRKILGIAVYNLSLAPGCAPETLRALIEGYFENEGLQIQVTMLSKEVLQDAMLHPERHEDLIVRVGGYSEYFNRLTPELKEAVYKRTVYNEL